MERIFKERKPRVIFLENVKNLVGHDKGNTFKTIIERLEDAGYNVKKTGNTTSISKTVITNKKDVTDESLKDIKNTLGVGSISTNKSNTSLVDVSIVIGKDF